MQHRPWARGVLTILAGAALALPLAPSPLSAQQAGVDVVIEVTNLRNEDGVVRACMTRDAQRFPRCQDSTQGYRTVVPAGEATTLRFRNVAPGTYAIALLHDENENGKADRVLGMMPREGFGFSNDAPVNMGPPDFEDAAITVGTTSLHQTIRMRYML
ncbi:DUF2141 domain-containing protein [Aurantiacibacter sp. MUD11]|uniref:DUF2141 domain-containing protein n=1 Tax=Aurantiacibacter sp. MUD11 TaxID=3003265 RepID=UPI0022AAA73C|nr:DUF2141 domain-containing protein [Aurantiacibacter sp. MUD11]WAT17121.1 DUF2141 domain-containing protein [Aurantiacibacter sp. MUD11]